MAATLPYQIRKCNNYTFGGYGAFCGWALWGLAILTYDICLEMVSWVVCIKNLNFLCHFVLENFHMPMAYRRNKVTSKVTAQM